MSDTSVKTDDNRRLLIVVINWHQEDETLPCLRQLRAQVPEGTSVLLVDNEGDKKSAAAFDSHPELFDHYHRFEENLGFTGGCNFGELYTKLHGRYGSQLPLVSYVARSCRLSARPKMN